MNWVEKLQELEEKKAQGIKLVSAAAFEDGKHVLEKAREILEKYYASQLEVLDRHIEEAKLRIVEKNRALGDREWNRRQHGPGQGALFRVPRPGGVTARKRRNLDQAGPD